MRQKRGLLPVVCLNQARVSVFMCVPVVCVRERMRQKRGLGLCACRLCVCGLSVCLSPASEPLRHTTMSP
jgi:hypothetical protein